LNDSKFSAAGPALGYLAQVDYALLVALERMDAEDDFALSLETLDDIVLHDIESDDPTEKLQSKHSIDSRRTLTDASYDLWKTLHNWLVEPTENNVRLVFLTVAHAGTAAAQLRPRDGRDVAAALRDLERTARESTSAGNAEYYRVFLGLDPIARRAFLERVEVVDGTASATELQPALERAVRKSVKQQRRSALVDRLRGWWHRRVVDHLDAIARQRRDRITAGELEDQLLEIADTLRDENLPIDVLDMPEPTDDEVSQSDRIFVAQLRLVAMSSERLRKCIYDHNRAFAQRSLWQRDRLLEVGELGRYDRELKEAWERFFLPAGDDEAVPGEDEVRRLARDQFVQLDRSDLPPIRRDVRQGWVARGSLQVISDRLEIGWHPDWLEHLKGRLAEVREEPGLEEAA
jgi:hypothetical protein